MVKRILLVLLVLLLLIQFIRPEKNVHPGTQPQALSSIHAIPANVNAILSKACYDCHSNNTYYPWYSNIQPVAWWLGHHVSEGKGELNFDEFASYPLKKQKHKLEEIAEAVEKGQMPLGSYTLIHTDTKLNAAEKETLISWVSSLNASMDSTKQVNQ